MRKKVVGNNFYRVNKGHCYHQNITKLSEAPPFHFCSLSKTAV